MIRKAGIEDIAAIRKIAEVVFPETYKEILSTEQIAYMMEKMYSEQSLLHQMTEDKHVFYICDGRGYTSFRYVGWTGDSTDHFHLEKLYVMPGHQGAGLGRRLFDTIVNAARDASIGCTRIELNVNRKNPAASFYEHLGMRKDREADINIGRGFYMNDYIMAVEFPAITK